MKQTEFNLFGRNLVLTRWAAILAPTAALMFLLFMATTFIWGGDASNGRIEQGKYYLAAGVNLHEVGRLKYALSAALSTLWPPILVLAMHFWLKPNLSAFLTQNATGASKVDTRKLLLVLFVFFWLIAAIISIASLICFLKATL